ncbi:MAG: ComEC/Rec2 family competence protein [Planctomycetales bacterium]|nr:ComEC/Rec2 family competence protein [Planctomycetales bacterium]
MAIAFGVGIWLDRKIDLLLIGWLAASSLLLVAWGASFYARRERLAMVIIHAVVVAVGGTWHHRAVRCGPDNHIVKFARETSQPARIVGTLRSDPIVLTKPEPVSPWSSPGSDSNSRVQCDVDCDWLLTGRERIAVSGAARLEIKGDSVPANAGDTVELIVDMSRPSGSRNPGGFDFREFLQAQGIQVVLRGDSPDAVCLVHDRVDWWGRSGRGWLRRHCEDEIARHLNKRTAAVGVGMLLGNRSNIAADVRAAFAESGTTHILAISGANVGILALLIWSVCRLLDAGRTATLLTVLIGIISYTVLTDAQPPVVRATFLILVLVAGASGFRPTSSVNSLGLAAIGVLAINPASLFDVGAQLSFLSVAAMIWVSSRAGGAPDITGKDPLDRLLVEASWFRQLIESLRVQLRLACRVTAAVWLVTLPLIVARFHLLSLVGFAINVVLVPLLVLVLWSGYLLLVCVLVMPPLAPVFARCYEWGLTGLLTMIENGARLPRGHAYTFGLPDWWLVGFYLAVATILWGGRTGGAARWGWRAIVAWCVLGLWGHFSTANQTGLRCTFLAVGHGGAILVEMPNGRTLLYDAGQMRDGPRAQRVIQNALWELGHSRLESLIVSHADADHFNAVPDLVKTIPVESLLVHPSFLDFRQPGVVAVSDAAFREHVPMRFLWSGDQLNLDDNVSIRVLHPPAGHGITGMDNANSLVLQIDYAGRSILLTGDLDGPGLEHLLRQPPTDVDVMLSPHHGSMAANPSALAGWARPDFVVVSNSRPDVIPKLRDVYANGSVILSTQQYGAITFEILPDGELRHHTMVRINGNP